MPGEDNPLAEGLAEDDGETVDDLDLGTADEHDPAQDDDEQLED